MLQTFAVERPELLINAGGRRPTSLWRVALKILNYHNVDRAPEGARLAKLYVAPDQFARQMACLKRLGLRGVSIGEALALRARGQTGGIIAITFDDGYLDNLREAAPILREFGFGATCYVVSGTLGTYNQWDAELLNARKPLMTANDLRSWIDAGFEIGSHTRSHPHLDEIDASDAAAEIAGSRADLESLTGTRIEHFWYPYGCYNDRVVEAVAAAGYKSAVTTERGRVTVEDDAFRLPRISINGNRSLLRFVLKAATPYGGWRKVKAAA